MKGLKFLVFILLICQFKGHVFGQLRPQNGVQASVAGKIAIVHANIYIKPGEFLKDAVLLIENGRIADIGVNLDIPSDFLVYDRSGFTILPAFIELNTDAGVSPAISRHQGGYPQLNSEKSGPYYWNEAIHPEINAISLLNSEDSKFKVLMESGFGFAVPRQADGIVQGSAPFIALGNLPLTKSAIRSNCASFYSFNKGVSQQTYPSSLMGSIALLRQAMYDKEYYRRNPEVEIGRSSMEAWIAYDNLPSFFKVGDKWDIYRVQRIAEEFNQPFVFLGNGDEYAIATGLKSINPKLVIPLDFPKAYDVADPYVAKNISLSELKHWELAPYNMRILIDQGISPAITSASMSAADFWKSIEKLLSIGTSPKDILAGLTTIPASFLGLDSLVGSLERGKLASFSVFNRDPFMFEAIHTESWNLGAQTELKTINTIDILGTYSLNINNKRFELNVSSDLESPKAKLIEYKEVWDTKLKIFKKDTVVTVTDFKFMQSDVVLQFSLPNAEKEMYLLHGKVGSNGSVWEGDATLPDGTWVQWSAVRRSRDKNEEKPLIVKQNPIPEVFYPNMAFGHRGELKQENAVYENVCIWTNETEGIIQNGYVVVQEGKISYVGAKKPSYPNAAKIIDGRNMHLTSGIIDEHSHIAISRGVNEGGQTVSAEVSIGDVVYPEDISIYRQLAGGVTAAQLLHGSANAIGGQSAIIKLKWGTTPEEMKIDQAAGFIKCALGENVKQANWGDRNVIRFPQTRMGVEQVFYDAFYRAKKYRSEQDAFAKGQTKIAPRKDIELDVLNEILEGRRFITCHSYVQSEVNMLMKVADSMGFKVNTFTHILEGYKVADKIKEHGVGASTFADWWAYKFEVNDAIPYNAALMHKLGITVAINSDDAEMGRRLNQEAAKTIKYGGVSEEEAWKMVTLNPAKLLHLDDKTGSIKVGKDADLVLWTANPLSIEAQVKSTMIEGVFYFDREQDMLLQAQNQLEKIRIFSLMRSKELQLEPKQPFFKRKKKHFHCDTMGEDGTESENLH